MAHTCSREKLEKEFPWIKQYRTKKWKVHELALPDDGDEYCVLGALISPLENQGIIICGAGSEVSLCHERRGGPVNDLFFFDLEQTDGLGLREVYAPVDYGFLILPWRGHLGGSIVLSVYRWVTGSHLPDGVIIGVAPYEPSEVEDAEAFAIAREELAKGASEEEVADLLKAGDYSAHQAVHIVKMAKQSPGLP